MAEREQPFDYRNRTQPRVVEKTPRKDSFGATNKISDPHKLTLAGYWDSPKTSQADADSLRKRRNSSGTARRSSILDLGSKVKDLVKETKEAAEDGKLAC